MELRQGQAFILGAVIFTSLFLIAILPSGPQIRSGDTSDIQSFFQKSFNEEKKMFNEEIGKNKSADYLKRKTYVYNQFLKQSVSLKGGSFRSYHFITLPRENEAVFINFQNRKTSASVYDNGWQNKTVEAYQYKDFSIDTNGNITLEVSDPSSSYEIRSFKPMLTFWMKITRESQSVENEFTG